MLRLPFVPKIKPDELLYSYILRASKANGCADVRLFAEFFLRQKDNLKHQKYADLAYDVDEDLSALVKALGQEFENDLTTFFVKTTVFSAFSPFVGKAVTSHRIGYTYGERKFKPLDPQPKGMLMELHACPKCFKEDGNDRYYRRAHQLPGVHVCYKHGTPLVRYIGKHGQELDADNTHFEEITLKKDSDYETKYAKFCKDLLNAELDLSFEDVRDALAPEIDYHNSSLNYVNIERAMSVAFEKYTTIEAFIKALKYTLTKNVPSNHINDKFCLIGNYRNDVITLLCRDCGKTFMTTPYRLEIGWQCPKCDTKYTVEKMYERLVEHVGNGEYKAISKHNGPAKPIKIKHLKCGRELETMARRFFDEGVRCVCEYTITQEEASKKIESLGDFSLIHFENTNNPVTIKSNSCGHIFEWSYHKFLQQPWCKICTPRVRTQEIFEKEIKDLVGDEYTLISDYIDKDTKVKIRHNSCGSTQEYVVSQFLDGRRCRYCTQFTKRYVLADLLYGISRGKYSFVKMKTPNIAEVRNNENGEIIELLPRTILQELYRPTPSPILVIENRDFNFERPKLKQEQIGSVIFERYEGEKFIHLEDIEIEGLSYVDIKTTIGNLAKKGILLGVEPGIYIRPDEEYAPWEVVETRFLLRNGEHIGYLTDFALAYELGLRSTPPKRYGIVSNSESQTHGRNRKYHGIDLKIHGSDVKVTSDNYKILATLTFLLSYKRLKCVDIGNVYETLKLWLEVDDITKDDFEMYYPYFAKWAHFEIEKVYKEEQNA